MKDSSNKNLIQGVFPLIGFDWRNFANEPYVRGADQGNPGYGGWRYPRSLKHLHRGIDLHVPVGTKILAVVDGEIELRAAVGAEGQFSYAGHRVILTHSTGATFKYFHLGTDNDDASDAFLSMFELSKRYHVKAGQIIGSVGFTGGDKAKQELLSIEDTHLHFEYYPRGEADGDENPATFLNDCIVHQVYTTPVTTPDDT